MANAKKCDRCTKFYAPYPGKPSTFNCNMVIFGESFDDGYKEEKFYDLCEECMKDICRYIRDKLD